jgi:hypothetical protein
MRESMFFELRVCRFGVWRAAVGLVAGAAIAALTAWAVAMVESQPQAGRGLVMAIAAGLSLATIGLAFSLARAEAGLLTRSEGMLAFVPDSGARRTGTLEVAIDFGAFLLLRLVERRRTIVWLPVQRRGVETQWHALRCAVYSPPLAAGEPTGSALPAE